MIRRSACLLALTVFPLSLRAQTRAELLRASDVAFRNHATEDSVRRLLRAAVNPALGRPDSAWGWGVQRLTRSLLLAADREVARVWARWGMRLHPQMKIDTVNLLPAAVGVLNDARLYTGSRTPADALIEMTWRWPAVTATAWSGQLELNSRNISSRMRVKVGDTTVVVGTPVTLRPGSYVIEASADGYVTARVTREVLPAVTTVVSIALMPVTAALQARSDTTSDSGATTPAGGILLPRSKAIADGQQCSSFQGPERAIDGNEDELGDRMWCQYGFPPAFLRIDLGKVCTVNRVVVVHADPVHRVADFQVQTSLDGVRWTPLGKAVRDNQESRTRHVDNERRSRLVRVHVTRTRVPRYKGEDVRIVEVIAYGPSAC